MAGGSAKSAEVNSLDSKWSLDKMFKIKRGSSLTVKVLLKVSKDQVG